MTFSKGRRALLAGPSACLALVLLAGCAVGGDDVSDVSDTPRRDLAGRPSTDAPVLPGASVRPTRTATTSAAPAASTAGSASSSSGTAQSSAVPSAGATGHESFHSVGSLSDLRNDQGLNGPAYADLLQVTVEDSGSRARVTVSMAGTLPSRTADGEVLGIGVDFYRKAGQFESDYQLFADGGKDGWFAYLSTPKGFVKYPGTFALGGTALSFTVPWSSLGAPQSGRFKAFADWTARRSTGNVASNDRAPAVADGAFDRG